MTTPNDVAGGREWNPYELATPITREAAAVLPPPLARTPVAGASPGSVTNAHARTDGGAALASHGARLAAALIDIALWCVPLLFVLRAAMQAYRMSALGFEVPWTLVGSKMGVALLLWAVLAVWNVVWLVQSGQTIGKRVVRIRIVRPDGTPAGAARLLLMRGGAFMLVQRLLGGINPLLGLAFWLADVLMIFSADRRCLHDRFADTIVVAA